MSIDLTLSYVNKKGFLKTHLLFTNRIIKKKVRVLLMLSQMSNFIPSTGYFYADF